MQNKETIAEGLKLSEEWAVINRYRIKKISENSETVSDTILGCISNVRQEVMGETSNKISEYEKKLVLTGFHIAQDLLSSRMDAGMGLASFLEKITKMKGNEDEE